MNVSRLLAVAVVGLALATDAGAQEGPRATVVLPTVGCRNPEDYTEAARLTKSRANDPGASAMLKDWLARHGCIGFQEGETVTVRKSAHFDNGSFVQLQRMPGARERGKGAPPPIYWTVPDAIAK